MKRFAATLLCTGLAFSASASDFDRAVVSDPIACPAGTTDASAHYKWLNGRLVRDGWVCEMRSRN